MLDLNPAFNQIWTPDTEYLIIVNYYDGDISWTKRLKLPYIIYYKNSPQHEPFNAINKAKSESNLCKFAAEFYDYLPKNLIIVHQYEYKWYHNGSIVDILNDPQLDFKYKNSITPGFYSINSYKLKDINIDDKLNLFKKSGFWTNVMEPYFGPIEGYHNFTRNKAGAAQFIVSRDNIRRLPREFWINIYKWLIENTIDETMHGYDPNSKTRLPLPTDHLPNSNYHTSRYLEWTWELIFTACINWKDKINDNFAAIYGVDLFWLDVTKHVQKYIYNNKLYIPKNIDFNTIFSDPVYGTEKSLIIFVHGEKFIFPENRNEDIKIFIDNIK